MYKTLLVLPLLAVGLASLSPAADVPSASAPKAALVNESYSANYVELGGTVHEKTTKCIANPRSIGVSDKTTKCIKAK